MKQRDPDGPLLPQHYTLYDRGNEHLHLRRARRFPWPRIVVSLFGIALLAIGYFVLPEYRLVLVLSVAAAGACLLLWFGPKLQVRAVPDLTPNERFDKENEARKTLAQIVAGLVVLISLYSATKTFETARDGQITDRFIKAIDELGATDKDGKPLLERRLGGIYALERVAQESERDHWPIMEVLTAYVRQHAPRVADEPVASAAVHPRADVQAVLTVIGRRSKQRVRFDLDRDHLLLLHQTDLRGAELSGAQLQNAMLIGAQLQRAGLFNAHLQGASLFHAHLQGADLRDTELIQAQLDEAICDKTTILPAGLKCGHMQ